ncbi:uncharacterized protein N7483_003883 [Penicillium malachiteum]|uniref:uncharacterized protein n=1 Tax=Penicillium malachiteum TaxID=1324776 RepID=UPI0025499288|nr:uncharacterized protein N7483_003883 [Penicillium malachiteum]KAJ5729375.1 hypothetical protein N7483_003883 [Penicillium malachiteum]
MSPQAFVLDGLWIALCPSFKQLVLSQPRQRIPKRCSLPTTGTAPTLHRRCYSSYLRRVINAHNPKSRDREKADTNNRHDETIPDHTFEPGSTSSPDHASSRDEAEEAEESEESYEFNGSRRRKHHIRKYRTVPESYEKKIRCHAREYASKCHGQRA